MAVINHGTVRGYKLGCRCEECTAANTVAKGRERDRRREREGKPPLKTAIVPTASKPSPQIDGPGPIEAAAREALAEAGGDTAIARMRREVVYRAASVMDSPKHAPFFKSAAEVLRVTVEELLAGNPEKDGEANELAGLLGSLRGSKPSVGKAGGAAAVGDAKKPRARHDQP